VGLIENNGLSKSELKVVEAVINDLPQHGKWDCHNYFFVWKKLRNFAVFLKITRLFIAV